MKTYDIKDDEGTLKAFEISNIGRRRIARFIAKLPDTKLLYVSKSFSWYFIAPDKEETVCKFEIAGIQFEVSEPFGDNSRYWIGPLDRMYHPEIEIVKDVFSAHR